MPVAKSLEVSLPLPQRKNLTRLSPTKYFYNFGVRKPVNNMNDLTSDQFWKCFINNWVCCLNIGTTPVFYKHILRDSRVIEIVFSGNNRGGDGVYTIYTCVANIMPGNAFAMPDEYILTKASEECTNYLAYLLKYKYINKEELRIFQNISTRDKFKNTIPTIRIN